MPSAMSALENAKKRKGAGRASFCSLVVQSDQYDDIRPEFFFRRAFVGDGADEARADADADADG